MIYPNSAKDRETAEYPYVELFRDFAAALCRPNSTLVTYGYSFGDDHINRVIRDMLTISGLANVRVYGAEKDDVLGIEQLIVPMWLWNTAEWVAFTQASGKAQKPTLVQALRCVRDPRRISRHCLVA